MRQDSRECRSVRSLGSPVMWQPESRQVPIWKKSPAMSSVGLGWAAGGLRPRGEALAIHDSREVRSRWVSIVTTGAGKWRSSLNLSRINYFRRLSFVCVKTIPLGHSPSIESLLLLKGVLKLIFQRNSHDRRFCTPSIPIGPKHS